LRSSHASKNRFWKKKKGVVRKGWRTFFVTRFGGKKGREPGTSPQEKMVKPGGMGATERCISVFGDMDPNRNTNTDAGF